MKAKLTLLVCGTSISAAMGQTIPFAGSYSQNFDGLGNQGTAVIPGRGPHALEGVLGSTGVSGWYGSNLLGSSNDTEVKAHDGSLASSAGRGVISYGATGSTERALGALPTSNQISRFGAILTNTSGQTIDDLTIEYTGEQWRRGNVIEPNFLAFAWGFTSSIDAAGTFVPELDFASPNMSQAPLEVAIDGNNPENQTQISWTLRGINWAPGTDLAVTWTINDITGQDNGIAIDDLRIFTDAECYPDCDTSTGRGVLDIFDFLCFGNQFSAGEPYACDCDTQSGVGVCDIFDFLCFGNAFSAGCP